jgi:hypothetical protein
MKSRKPENDGLTRAEVHRLATVFTLVLLAGVVLLVVWGPRGLFVGLGVGAAGYALIRWRARPRR